MVFFLFGSLFGLLKFSFDGRNISPVSCVSSVGPVSRRYSFPVFTIVEFTRLTRLTRLTILMRLLVLMGLSGSTSCFLPSQDFC
jgi:hypothetical protein